MTQFMILDYVWSRCNWTYFQTFKLLLNTTEWESFEALSSINTPIHQTFQNCMSLHSLGIKHWPMWRWQSVHKMNFFYMNLIKTFRVHILFHYDRINTSSCKLSLHAVAKVRGERERENPNPCHTLPLKIQTCRVMEIGVSREARKGTQSFSVVMKCLRESRKGS
jgi:hypothetical protein